MIANLSRVTAMTSALPASSLASARTLSTSASYSDICAAFRMMLGLVVASCGVNLRMDSKSPVSTIMIVYCSKESR